MGKIITGGEANTIAGRTVFPSASLCPTYNELITNGFTVAGSYANNQLVEAAYVTAGGYNPVEMTAIINWNTGTSSLTQSITNIFTYEYYIELKADNADQDNLRFDNPVKMIPNILQNTGSGTSVFNFTIDDHTTNIIATVWCNYPTGWYGTEYHWTSYEASYGANVTKAGTFINQAVFQDPKSVWRYGSGDPTQFHLDLDITGWVSGQTYGMQATTLKKEINKILNDDNE